MLGLVTAAPADAATSRPLETAFADHGELDGPDADLAIKRARAAGARVYRTVLRWYEVAPAERPEGFRPEDPADSAYHWAAFDLKIRRLVAQRIEPLVTVNFPPVWAGGGYAPTPNTDEFAKFMTAAARRYSGSFQGLPRIRLWQIWNEANVNLFLNAQLEGAQPLSPSTYRRLVNAGAGALKAVHRDNVVVAGGLSPFGTTVEQAGGRAAIAPLRFMREFLCLSDGAPPTPTCADRVTFDVWATHPYTRGGPTHHASAPDDVSIGDLPKMRALLAAAAKVGHLTSTGKARMWATEFSWDTSPPDPEALPMPLHARWTAEALYRMWSTGLDLVTWLQLRDTPFPDEPTQSGLYFRGGRSLTCDEPKLSLTAFRFPFVALKQPGGTLVWGRAPGGVAGRVNLEQLDGKKWKGVGSLRTDRNGVFTKRLKLKARRGSFNITHSYKRRYSQLVACDGPRSYWRVGDAPGQGAKDEEGKANGAYAGDVGRGGRGALATDTNAGVTLNAGESRVSLGVVGYVRTVELWLKTGATNAVAFSNRDDTSHFIYIGTDGDGKLLIFDSAPLVSTRAVTDSRWHHVVYTYAGGTGRLYLDGALEASASWERIEGGAPASLGYDVALGNRFVGSLDEVAVYDDPLTETQVKQHYAAASKNLSFSQTTPFLGGYLRARAAGGTSLPFGLLNVADRPVKPFG